VKNEARAEKCAVLTVWCKMAGLIRRGFLQVSKFHDLETFLDRQVSSDLTAPDVFLTDYLASKLRASRHRSALNCKSAWRWKWRKISNAFVLHRGT
jgi:hypothetical protein